MKAVRCLVLATIWISSNLMLAPSCEADEPEAPTIETRGEAKRIVRRNKVEVLELRGARSNPNFVEESFHKSEAQDLARWNHQHENITPVRGLKRSKSRMPASETVVKHPAALGAKHMKGQDVALQNDASK